MWCTAKDLNPEPLDPKSSALSNWASSADFPPLIYIGFCVIFLTNFFILKFDFDVIKRLNPT